MHDLLRELEIKLSHYLEEQLDQEGPQAWRQAWLRLIDSLAEPFDQRPEEPAKKTWPNGEEPG